MGTVIVHVLLLLMDGADRVQTLRLARGQIFSEGQFAIDGIQVKPVASQWLCGSFSRCVCGILCISGNLCAAVSAGSRLAVSIIIVILSFGFFDLTLLCVPHDHLIDLTQHFRRQALAEIHHQRRVKGQLFIIIARIPAEILKIWVLLNLKRGFLVRIANSA